jgi:hypothetical protein
LSFSENSPKDLESLVQSSRIFEELKYAKESNDYLLTQEKFGMIEEYLNFMGPQIKKLVIRKATVDPKIVQKLLNLLPNLKVIELDSVKANGGEEPIKLS